MTTRAGAAADETNDREKESDAVPVDAESATGADVVTVAEETTDDAEHDTGQSAPAEESGEDRGGEYRSPAKPPRRISFSRLLVFAVLPGVVLSLAGTAGYLKWQSASLRASQAADIESVAVAKDGTIAMLSYQPDTVEKDLGAARDRLTGTFKESYTQLTHDVVIPGAKQRHISAVATVPAAASVSASPTHAVTLVFVNQTVTVGSDAPSATASSVRVTLDKVGDRWLISGFDPI